MTAQSPIEDLALLNGSVYRVPGDPVPAEGLAIRDGVIVTVGSSHDVRASVPSARAIDLEGRSVLPSFIDSHTHFHRAATLSELHLDFEALAPTTIEQVLAAVRGRAARTPDEGWIEGDSISAGRLQERRLPHRHELDQAGGGHPVIIRGSGKHVVAASSAALALAGIDRDTPDPPGGRIERDATGAPTGILHERAKLRLDTSAPDTVVPPIDPPRRREAVRNGVGRLHALGITTIHEMVRLPEEAGDLAELHQADDLDLRVRVYYRVHETPIALDWLIGLGLRSGVGDDRFRVNGVKISVDGWCIFGNAAVHEPYDAGGTGSGLLRIEQAELFDLVARADAAGLAVAVHAVGARAVDMALDAFTALDGARSGPHRIEHAHLDVGASQLDRMAALGVLLSVQPSFLQAYADDWAERLAPDRVDRIMPMAAATASGIRLLVNSDMPSGPAGPLKTIAAAAHRSDRDGARQHPEALSVAAAWRAHTTTPAEATGDRAIGRIGSGRRADLIVVEGAPFTEDGTVPDAVGATLFDGAPVFDPHGWFA